MRRPSLHPLLALLGVLSLGACHGETLQDWKTPETIHSAFDFKRDTFAFANETVFEYKFPPLEERAEAETRGQLGLHPALLRDDPLRSSVLPACPLRPDTAHGERCSVRRARSAGRRDGSSRGSTERSRDRDSRLPEPACVQCGARAGGQGAARRRVIAAWQLADNVPLPRAAAADDGRGARRVLAAKSASRGARGHTLAVDQSCGAAVWCSASS